SVKDTGIGIRAEDMDKLFESFSRLEEKRNRNIEGTGLGMSIVTKLLSMMGSELKVQSVYGEGSEFSFALYQKIADNRPMGSFSAGQAPASGRITKAVGLYAPDARVLVVDDNEMNLKVAQNLLGLFGIEPSVAHSGYEAIELIKQNDHMLILLDHMMPKLDGIETLTALKEGRLLKEGTKVIALSANAITGAREGYLAAGFDDYISKPIDIDELEKVLSRYLPESCIKARDNEELSDDNDAKRSSFESALPENIDTAAGLKNCMDDESFYRELLSDYASSAEEKINRLESFKNDGLTEDYRILIHSIKSSSKTVGDLKAAELAQSLEAAAAGRDMQFINEHHREFCEGLRLTAELITKALS
ncbi:MAG: response regulator, partial [Ruminococcus sp.]|nr:response regulator [Ruminococcus sp.]